MGKILLGILISILTYFGMKSQTKKTENVEEKQILEKQKVIKENIKKQDEKIEESKENINDIIEKNNENIVLNETSKKKIKNIKKEIDKSWEEI